MIYKNLGKIYLSGKMTGEPEYNHPLFNRKAKELRALGFEVFNPAENDGGTTDKKRSFYLREDIRELLDCDTVMVLAGWRKSKGALLEVNIARELELQIITEDFNCLSDETICEEADYLVSEDRGNHYGHPNQDFTRTGRIWGAVLEKWAKKTQGDKPIPPELVGLCMVGVKISREVHLPKRDNRVDGVGYFKTVDMIEQLKSHNKDTSL